MYVQCPATPPPPKKKNILIQTEDMLINTEFESNRRLPIILVKNSIAYYPSVPLNHRPEYWPSSGLMISQWDIASFSNRTLRKLIV